MMPVPTQLQVDILLKLSDNMGYSNSQLAKVLGKRESNISKPLGELEDEGLIFKERRISREDKRRSDFPYYLNKSKVIKIFELVMARSVKAETNLQNTLSNSNFINYIVNNLNLVSFFKLFEDLSSNPQIKIISMAIFANKAVNEECKRFLEKLSTSSDDSSRVLTMLTAQRLVETLQNFDPLEALNFYKNSINKTFSGLYGKIATENGDKNADLLRTFLEYDISLSPFSSFPVNRDPILLLFMRPFERIYDDVYLIEESDSDMMIQRAYFIYSNFSKILISGIISMRKEVEEFETIIGRGIDNDEGYEQFKKDHFIRFLRKDLFYKREHLNPLIKELIFYWNIASLRLDWVYYKLNAISKISPGTKKKCHIISDADGIQAIDLDTYKKAFHQEATREAMMITALWSGKAGPFKTLRYCNCFRGLDLEEKQIKTEDILSEVEESLNFQ